MKKLNLYCYLVFMLPNIFNFIIILGTLLLLWMMCHLTYNKTYIKRQSNFKNQFNLVEIFKKYLNSSFTIMDEYKTIFKCSICILK